MIPLYVVLILYVIASMIMFRSLTIAQCKEEEQRHKLITAHNTNFTNLVGKIHNLEIEQTAAKNRTMNNAEQIEDIIGKLEGIIADIHRIDEDEKEIRKYYLNFREPVTSDVVTAGVTWAAEYPETENDEERS